MQLTIKNATPILTAELNTLGAAVKIILAGGSSLGGTQMRIASGASRFVWDSKGMDIVALVNAMEAENAPAAE